MTQKIRQVRAARKRNTLRPVFCVLYEILYEQDDDELKRFLWIPPRPLSDCLSGKSTRGMPGGRFVGEERISEPRTRWLRVDAKV